MLAQKENYVSAQPRGLNFRRILVYACQKPIELSLVSCYSNTRVSERPLHAVCLCGLPTQVPSLPHFTTLKFLSSYVRNIIRHGSGKVKRKLRRAL